MASYITCDSTFCNDYNCPGRTSVPARLARAARTMSACVRIETRQASVYQHPSVGSGNRPAHRRRASAVARSRPTSIAFGAAASRCSRQSRSGRSHIGRWSEGYSVVLRSWMAESKLAMPLRALAPFWPPRDNALFRSHYRQWLLPGPVAGFAAPALGTHLSIFFQRIVRRHLVRFAAGAQSSKEEDIEP